MSSITVGIFDLGRGTGRLDSALSQPISLLQFSDGSVTLDWIKLAIESINPSKTIYFGSYQIQKVIEKFPDFDFRYTQVDKSQEAKGELDEYEINSVSAFIKQTQGDLVIVTANTILLPEAIEKLISTETIDSTLLEKEGELLARWGALSEGPAPIFSGVLFIPASARVNFIREVEQSIREASIQTLSQLFEHCLETQRKQFQWIALDGVCAPNQNQKAIAKTLFKGKAKTLEQLRNISADFVVLDQVSFSVSQWIDDSKQVLGQICSKFGQQKIVVRSSTTSEDNQSTSAAGLFESVLDLSAAQLESLSQAIEKVIESYTRSGRKIEQEDCVLVQPQVENIISSGVAFSRELSTRSPYFVVCIDRLSGRSDSITSGAAFHHDTYYVLHNANVKDIELESDVQRLVESIKALINYTCFDELDIEFAIDHQGILYLFQVRPMVFNHSSPHNVVLDDDLHNMLRSSVKFIESIFRQDSLISGELNVLSNMSDWNPAEMLGSSPRPLALSLYQYLIGKSVWSQSRAELGYFDCTPTPLILSVAGKPFVDLRASLNSLMPDDLSSMIKDKWVSYCLRRVKLQPNLHDKVEFEVTPSCELLDWTKFENHFESAGLNQDEVKEFKRSFARLSSELLNEKIIEQELDKLLVLEKRRKKLKSNLNLEQAEVSHLARVIQHLVEDCRILGTKPFAILARLGFVALIQLKHLSELGLIEESGIEKITIETPTVACDVREALKQLESGALGYSEFVTNFGHLRERSYEITSLSYRQRFLPHSGTTNQKGATVQADSDNKRQFKKIPLPSGLNLEKLDRHLQEKEFSLSASQLVSFIQQAIYAREQAKFEFMKSVDLILDLIDRFGAGYQLTTDDTSFLTIQDILKFADSSDTGAAVRKLKRSVGFNRKQMRLTRAIHLPEVVSSPKQIYAFKLTKGVPNFVTELQAKGEVVCINDTSDYMVLDGKIVVIEAADPGFDWIFAHSIKGLITCYGGVGSHMAIRAAEFQVPAAIGCGEAIYLSLKSCKSVVLDCRNKLLSVL